MRQHNHHVNEVVYLAYVAGVACVCRRQRRFRISRISNMRPREPEGLRGLEYGGVSRCAARGCLFGNDLEGHFDGYFFVELDGGGILAHFLDGFLDFDDLAVDVVAELFEGFGNLDGVDGAEDGAGG